MRNFRLSRPPPVLPRPETRLVRAVKDAVCGNEPCDGGFQIGDIRGCLEPDGLEDTTRLIL
jgi:hypothetical protein